MEDSRSLASLLAEGLSYEGIATDLAYDGNEAASKVAVHRYDVVVLDRTLPGLSGDTLCQMISTTSERPMVLMLSGAASAEERVDGLSRGADDYLVKPFHFAELVLRLRALARRKPQAQARLLRVSDIEIDCLSRLARRNGRSLALSAKELSLLEVLMAASPGYRSAEQLLESVWDEHADPFTNVVTMTIARLRRKLGEPQVIETAIRVGYRIAAEMPSLAIESPR